MVARHASFPRSRQLLQYFPRRRRYHDVKCYGSVDAWSVPPCDYTRSWNFRESGTRERWLFLKPALSNRTYRYRISKVELERGGQPREYLRGKSESLKRVEDTVVSGQSLLHFYHHPLRHQAAAFEPHGVRPHDPPTRGNSTSSTTETRSSLLARHSFSSSCPDKTGSWNSLSSHRPIQHAVFPSHDWDARMPGPQNY